MFGVKSASMVGGEGHYVDFSLDVPSFGTSILRAFLPMFLPLADSSVPQKQSCTLSLWRASPLWLQSRLHSGRLTLT